MMVFGKQFDRAVRRAIRDDNDLLNIRVVQAEEMGNLAREQRHAIVHGEHDADARA